MQRTPGQRNYGSSDAARLRSLASRGVALSPPQPRPATSKRKERSDGSRSGSASVNPLPRGHSPA
ncbi:MULTISPECIES: hypothetical protein [Rhodanobacteraceae]|uniref:hypothetical protein n=1 Tax=Rhodanobacteraceae TaxID=1775411 RepID=UPI0009C8E25D|nr:MULTISPECIES: hypothetical protein [Rhodanobacteraceae]SKB66550.1 hypothetical protein SAMN05660880_02060 [Luteibacter sp. 22Crub2.1]